MPCKNCNCGKADNMQKKVILNSGNETVPEIKNRLYLLGFLTSYYYLNNDKIDKTLISKLIDMFPNDISIDEQCILSITDTTLSNFFTISEEEEFAPLKELIDRTDTKIHKYFWRGYVEGYTHNILEINNFGIPTISLIFFNEILLNMFLDFLNISECDANIQVLNEDMNSYHSINLESNKALNCMNLLYVEIPEKKEI